ncbi:LytTR family DNA-binding domain-containing protein [Paenibacillus graminis]|uniref:LytTR family DNA-binding domain-containing protein n=2 Tax=Paenibacillus graminis TaxID=189425 RepID=UPI002DBB3CC5|nr:LytTR family transcriptional regulator DNA-binding domain-containing protein [Paenibacillus graminis]MEC0169086.1 LytTR family transcriptional regulator DNA-binding domain-containing protein [Paenibacillus graminis]
MELLKVEAYAFSLYDLRIIKVNKFQFKFPRVISIKISIEVIDLTKEEEIRIRCHQVDEEIHELVNKIKTETLIILGYHEDKISRIKLSDIYYFEAVDGKVFGYGKNNVHEVKQKLYELEELCKEKHCFRASKSTILNITKIASIHPSISGRFHALLDNGEKVVISRQYVPILKHMLGL